MRQLPYTLNPPKQRSRHTRYRREELERMSLLQLRDICEQEEIIHAALEQMGRDELIELILQFRGSRMPRLILGEIEGGQERLQESFQRAVKRELTEQIPIPATLVAYKGLETNVFDGFSLPYLEQLDGVNAFVVDQMGKICAIWQVQSYPGEELLYLTRSSALPCWQSDTCNYRLCLLPKDLSDIAFDVYRGSRLSFPPEIQFYSMPLLDLVVLEPAESTMPLAVDFGTSNTAAGVFVDSLFYSRIQNGIQQGQVQPEAVNYVQFLSPEGERVPILPTVIGVERIENGEPIFNIGHEAEKMIAGGYLGDGFCVFYDMKRWVSSFEEKEELSDTAGNRLLYARKEIVGAFLQYVIDSAQQRFKCLFSSIYLSYPVKQRERFLTLYREALPGIQVIGEDLIDEGVSVLYSTIGRLIDQNNYQDGAWYKALIVDCGGGTTDLSSCRFRIRNERVSFCIDIETAYENGDTDFGGNNLTMRIMQLLKITAARQMTGQGASLSDIASSIDMDLYRAIDAAGNTIGVYQNLDEAYLDAEHIIPTRFKEYEFRDREAYYMVRNNFYFLFTLAEKVKKILFSTPHILQVFVGSKPQILQEDSVQISAPKWKLAARLNGQLALQREFPPVLLNTVFVKSVLHPDIYEIIRRFFDNLYNSGELQEYSVINLTGQSCKIDIFRDCLKEYLPGKRIRGRKEGGREDYRLKLTCLEGAIRYISDKRLGYVKAEITSLAPALPYTLCGYTHTGMRIPLIEPHDRSKIHGSISRSVESAELRLHLLNSREEEKYIYNIFSLPDTFRQVTYKDIQDVYGAYIPQSEVDAIENGEVRYFVWTEVGQWGFSVVPVSRQNEQLSIGEQQLFPFEHENWIVHYFDGSW